MRPDLTAPAATLEAPGRGRGTIRARRDPTGRTVLERAHASSPLRFLRPTFPGTRAAGVCLVTFGPGLMNGDAIDLEIVVEQGATLVVFTQSNTKAFRGASRQNVRAEVHGTLVFLPDPVACFRGARYRQRVDITLHDEGSAVVLDGFTSGRAAYGDRWAFDSIDLATTVRRLSRVIVRDAVRLDVADGPVAPRLDRYEALVTVLAVGPRVAPVAASLLGPALVTRGLVAAPSSLASAPDGAIVRIAATRPADALAEARSRLRNLPDIDVVDPFASRR